jgi:NAD(P)-dependent dehydrogenase (short-subunit alcohol dehydrogenase family)
MRRLEGKRILVTGAASGIGQATALRLLDEGATVVASDVAADGLATTATRAREAATADRLATLPMDVGEEDSVIDGVRWAVETLAGLDSVVNAAGMLRAAHTHETSLELWDQIVRVNLTGTFLVVRETLPALLANSRSAIVNFSSTSASFAHPYMAAYAASKGGIQAFTHSLALEYAREGLRAVCVAPVSLKSRIEADADPAHDRRIQRRRDGRARRDRRRHCHAGVRRRRLDHGHRNPHRRRHARLS